MKNLSMYISAIILSLILFISNMQTADNVYAQDSEDTKSVVDQLLDELKDKPKEAVMQNMYLDIYKKVNEEPAKKTTKTVSKKFGMSEDQINKIVRDGDLSPLLTKNKDLTLDQVTSQYVKIFDDYQNTLATENLRTELEAEVKPSEIFMDGDTSNSEFDILYDLTIIEVILFNEGSTSEFGGTFPPLDIDITDESEIEEIAELFEEPLTEEVETDEEIITTKKEFDALECIDEDSDLEKSLSDFEESQEGEGGIEEIIDEEEEVTIGEDDFPTAVSDEWPSATLCPDGGFFCIEIDFDFGSGKAYSKKDNCIACHVQKINEELDKMLGKPLSANKLSGNLFEVPKCKTSFTNLPANMNIITVAVPPPRQNNQDKIFQIDIEKEWQKFMETYNPLFYKVSDEKQSEKDQEPAPTVADRSAKKALSNASPNATLDEVVTRAEQQSQGSDIKTQDNVNTKTQELQAGKQNFGYQLIIDEMSTMNSYFKSIKETFEKMKTPCQELATKPYCS